MTHNKYKGRIKVINESYNLVISDLNMKDTGKYKADITTTDTNTITRSYYLHVYRKCWGEEGMVATFASKFAVLKHLYFL